MMVALALRVIMRLIVGAQYKFHTLTHNRIVHVRLFIFYQLCNGQSCAIRGL